MPPRIKEHPAASDGLVNPFLIIFRKFLFLEDKLMTSQDMPGKCQKDKLKKAFLTIREKFGKRDGEGSR